MVNRHVCALLIVDGVQWKRTLVIYQYGQSHISGGAKGAATESDVTGSQVILTGNDVTGSALTGNDVSHVRRMRNRFPRFFLTIVVVQNWASPICLPDVMSRDPEGVSIGRVCACATASCSISALLGPFNRKWRHQMSPVGLPLELEVTWPDVLLGVVSRTSGSYNLIIF